MYLGPDVPVDAWVDIARRTKARAAVIGVVTDADQAPAAAVVDALRAGSVGIVAIGGAAASQPSDSDGVVVLPSRVVDAAEVIAQAIGRRP